MTDHTAAPVRAIDLLQRAREIHQQTCILARGDVQPSAFRCGMCEILNAPTVQAPAADRAALRDRIAEALLGTPREGWTYEPGREKWDHHKHGDRPGHTYSISCALCTGDVETLADAVLAEVPTPTNWVAVLSGRAKAMLSFALDIAQEEIHARSLEISSDDRTALDQLQRLADEAQPEQHDTLPAWLHQRFGTRGQHAQTWDALTDNDRSYWEHEARAVRRAVARGGFKQPAAGAQQDGARS
jgi:hypothetical protein